MIEDPRFYATAALAVLILGIAKGGFAGGIGLVAVPLMSLTIEPARAAAILLPILMLMDATALRPWWRKWDVRSLWTTAPGAVVDSHAAANACDRDAARAIDDVDVTGRILNDN